MALLDPTTWSDNITSLVKSGAISVIPFEMELNYDHWSARESVSWSSAII